MDSKNQRKSLRIAVRYNVILHTDEGDVKGICTNISSNGMCINELDTSAPKNLIDKVVSISFPDYDPEQTLKFLIIRETSKGELGLSQTFKSRLQGNFLNQILKIVSKSGQSTLNGHAQPFSMSLGILKIVVSIEQQFIKTFIAAIIAFITSLGLFFLYHMQHFSEGISMLPPVEYIKLLFIYLFTFFVTFALSIFIVNKIRSQSAHLDDVDDYLLSFAEYHSEVEENYFSVFRKQLQQSEENRKYKKEVTLLMDALRKSGQQLQHLTEMSGDLIWTTDTQGILTSGSNAFRNVLGYQPEEITSKPLFDLVADQVKSAFDEMLTKVSSGEKITNFESILIHKDGSFVDVSFNAMPFRDEKQNNIGISGTLAVLTEQKKIERSLRDNQKLLINDESEKKAFLDTTVEMDRVLSAQLTGVSDMTEEAAVKIMGLTQGLDDKMTELVDYMTQANNRASDLGNSSRQVIEEDKQAISDLQSFIADTDVRQKQGHQRVMQAMEKVRDLRSLVQLVLDISDRTNTVSLNARIVAAQAGEHGHKFGVVATEVRKLSDQVKQAAQKIDDGIENAANTVESVLSSQFDTDKMGQEENMLKKAATQMSLLGEHYGELLEFNQATMEKITDWNQVMSHSILDLLGNIQFQDVTRQRLEHVADALNQRSEYADTIISKLRDPHLEISLDHLDLDSLYQNYVMADQREAHAQAMGEDTSKEDSGEDLPIIELF
ncbi:PAS domain S-box protein [Magnetococcales bacterium HHB-1]